MCSVSVQLSLGLCVRAHRTLSVAQVVSGRCGIRAAMSAELHDAILILPASPVDAILVVDLHLMTHGRANRASACRVKHRNPQGSARAKALSLEVSTFLGPLDTHNWVVPADWFHQVDTCRSASISHLVISRQRPSVPQCKTPTSQPHEDQNCSMLLPI